MFEKVCWTIIVLFGPIDTIFLIATSFVFSSFGNFMANLGTAVMFVAFLVALVGVALLVLSVAYDMVRSYVLHLLKRDMLPPLELVAPRCELD